MHYAQKYYFSLSIFGLFVPIIVYRVANGEEDSKAFAQDEVKKLRLKIY